MALIGCMLLMAGSHWLSLAPCSLPGSVSAEPAIEAQTLFLAINELYGVLLGAEIDRCDGLGRPLMASDWPRMASNCL